MSLEPLTDPSIQIKPSDKLRNYIVKKLKVSKNIPNNIKELKKCKKDKEANCFLNLKDIKWLKEYLKNENKSGDSKVYLHELLGDINLILPKPAVTQRNPELEARIQKLKAQQDDRDYKAMTKSVDSLRKHLPEDTIAYQMKAINKQLIAVAQFVFSVIAGFAFGFIGVELLFGNLDFGFRLLLGIMCALVIALAEIYFLAKKLNEDYDDQGIQINKLHQE